MTVRAADRVVTLQNVQVGGDLNIYVDGLPQARPQVRNHFDEGRRLQREEQHLAAIREFESAFAAAEDDSQRCALYILIGNSFSRLSRPVEAEAHFLQAQAIAEHASDERARAAAVGNLGIVYLGRGELDKAEDHLSKALAIDEGIGDRLGEALGLGNLGILYQQRGESDKAQDLFKRSLAIAKQLGDPPGQASQLGNLGIVCGQRGDLRSAESTSPRLSRSTSNSVTGSAKLVP